VGDYDYGGIVQWATTTIQKLMEAKCSGRLQLWRHSAVGDYNYSEADGGIVQWATTTLQKLMEA
jgi:hypothetical protein